MFSQDLSFKKILLQTYPNDFHIKDELIFIGTIKTEERKLDIYENTHIFGNNRMNWKLIIVVDDKIAGWYTQIQETPTIENNKLIFPFPEEYGYMIDFSNGIPDKVWIDGEIFNFYAIETSAN